MVTADVGRICLSRAGRDRGRYFMVTARDGENYVLVADGVVRKLAKPKKKKIKHLKMTPIVLEGIAQKLAEGTKVFDAELRSAIIQTGLIVQKEE